MFVFFIFFNRYGDNMIINTLDNKSEAKIDPIIKENRFNKKCIRFLSPEFAFKFNFLKFFFIFSVRLAKDWALLIVVLSSLNKIDSDKFTSFSIELTRIVLFLLIFLDTL